MPRIASDTQELHHVGETAPPTSASVPHAGRSVLERLLATLCQLPPGTSMPDLVTRVLRDLSEILPGYALGVRIPGDAGTPEILLSIPPIETPPDDPWAPDTVLFPSQPHERRVPLGCRPEPASLHCAADDPALDKDGSSIVGVVEQCAQVMSTAIRFADNQRAVTQRDREIEKLQHMVVQSEKLASLGEISAGLVHELTNPLTSIVAYTDYLRQKLERRGDDPEDIERLRRVGEAADLILSFTRSIVTYAKPQDDAFEPVDVADAIDQAFGFCRHVIEDSRVTSQRRVDDELPRVHAVRGQLVQVLVNLMTNACQAMWPQGGRLTVAASAGDCGQAVRIQVEDTGPGIDRKNLDRVFDPFFTTKAEGVGTGLGLCIVHQIVERCGGMVSVDSSQEDGAAFVVEIPVFDREAT